MRMERKKWTLNKNFQDKDSRLLVKVMAQGYFTNLCTSRNHRVKWLKNGV
jgi:hypothetical protein